MNQSDLSSVTNKLQDIANMFVRQMEPEIDFYNKMPLVEFTLGELTVISWIVRGKSNKEIAKIMGLSEGRVRNIIYQITQKTGLKDRTQIAVYAVVKRLLKNNTPPQN